MLIRHIFDYCAVVCLLEKLFFFNNIEDLIFVFAPYILQFFWELLWGGLFKFKSATAMFIYNVFGVDSIILSLVALIGNDLTKMELFLVIIIKEIFCLYYIISEDKKQKP